MSPNEADGEVVTLALAPLFIYAHMGFRPGRRTPPKPSSALAVLRGVRRTHDRLGIQMADLGLATKVADSLGTAAGCGVTAVTVVRATRRRATVSQARRFAACPCTAGARHRRTRVGSHRHPPEIQGFGYRGWHYQPLGDRVQQGLSSLVAIQDIYP